MPTDPLAQTNHANEEGFPIVIGFQPELSDETELADTGPLAGDEQNEQKEPLTGYDLVEDMMRRQDEVLRQLDDLNAQVESAIEEIAAVRKSEIEAMQPEAEPADEASDLQRRAA